MNEDNAIVILDEDNKIIKRHMLHASSICFTHPFTNKKVNFSADIPLDMKNLIKLWTDEI